MCENPVSCTLGNGTYLYFALGIFSNFILKHIDSYKFVKNVQGNHEYPSPESPTQFNISYNSIRISKQLRLVKLIELIQISQVTHAPFCAVDQCDFVNVQPCKTTSIIKILNHDITTNPLVPALESHTHSPSPLSPVPTNTNLFSIFLIMLFHNCNMRALCSVLAFFLSIIPWDSSKLFYVAIVCSFILLSSIPWYECTTICLTIHPLGDNQVVPGFWIF